jgi:hypothetical protein
MLTTCQNVRQNESFNNGIIIFVITNSNHDTSYYSFIVHKSEILSRIQAREQLSVITLSEICENHITNLTVTTVNFNIF